MSAVHDLERPGCPFCEWSVETYLSLWTPDDGLPAQYRSQECSRCTSEREGNGRKGGRPSSIKAGKARAATSG